jgi:hypothetical protein
MFASPRVRAATALAFLVFAIGCSKSASQEASPQARSKSQSKIEPNLTDLPTYPNLTSGSMLGHPPTQGAVYNATTNDSYDKVVAWYRARLHGAKEEHSGYYDSTQGNWEIEFHLTKWNEQVMINANPKQYPGTSIALGQDAHQ